jgi:hypothetical protein
MGPVAVISKAVPVAQRHNLLRPVEDLACVAAHLVQQGFVCEGKRDAVDVLQPPGMCHGLFDV